MEDEGLKDKSDESHDEVIAWPLLEERQAQEARSDAAQEYPFNIKLPLGVVRGMERVVKAVYRLLRRREKKLKTRGEAWRQNEKTMRVLRTQSAPEPIGRKTPVTARIDTDTGRSLDITTPQNLHNALSLSSNVRDIELVESTDVGGGATVSIRLELNTRGNTDVDNLTKLFNEGGNPFGPFKLSGIEFKNPSGANRTEAFFTISATLSPPTQEDLERVEIDKPGKGSDQGEKLPITEFEFTPRFRDRLLNQRYLTEGDIGKLMDNQSSANRILKTYDAWEGMRILMPKDMSDRGGRLAWKGSAALQAVVEHLPGRMHRRLLPELAHRYYSIFYARYFQAPAEECRDALFPLYEKVLQAIDEFTTDPQADILDLQKAILSNALILSMVLKGNPAPLPQQRLSALMSEKRERDGQVAHALAREILRKWEWAGMGSSRSGESGQTPMSGSQGLMVELAVDPGASNTTGRLVIDQFNSLPDRPQGLILKRIEGLPAKNVTCIFHFSP